MESLFLPFTWSSQDDAFTESFISTIGVDFVRLATNGAEQNHMMGFKYFRVCLFTGTGVSAAIPQRSCAGQEREAPNRAFENNTDRIS